jgi:hypothetical protein
MNKIKLYKLKLLLQHTKAKDKLAKLIQFSSFLLANAKYKYNNLDGYNKFLQLYYIIYEARALIRIGVNFLEWR